LGCWKNCSKISGLGLELLKETICMCCPNIIIQMGDNMPSSQDRNRMPDVTLDWLLQQPVFVPYRVWLKFKSFNFGFVFLHVFSSVKYKWMIDVNQIMMENWIMNISNYNQQQ
jgi:hypothetical protein